MRCRVRKIDPRVAFLVSQLPQAAIDALIFDAMRRKSDALVSAKVDWCPHTPHPGPQTLFDNSDAIKEILYGGAAGGGKTDAILRAALKYVNVKGYAAVIFRRTYPMLTEADSVIPRSREWMPPSTGAKWNETNHMFTFPSGATLRFRHLKDVSAIHNYQGSAYQFIGFDELTQFHERQYTYLFSRCRRPADAARELSEVPLRIRATSNPGGIGHDWVKKRFITRNTNPTGRLFIKALLKDNPSLDAASYLENLAELDAITRAQLELGDWDITGDQLIASEWVLDCYNENTLWPFGIMPTFGRTPELYVGVDIGRTQDRTVIAVVEKLGSLLWLRELAVFQGMPFEQQKIEIQKRVRLRGVVRCCIDRGGIGWQLAEWFEANHRGICEGVQLTEGRQGQIAIQMESTFSQRSWRIPGNDAELDEDLGLVRKSEVKNGVPVIVTQRGASGHADRFWSMGLALFGMPYREKRSPTILPKGIKPK